MFDNPILLFLFGSPGLWFAPAYLFADIPILSFLMALLCLWLMWKLTIIVFHDMHLRQGLFAAYGWAGAVLYFPGFFALWYWLYPHRDRTRHQLERSVRHDVLPAWEEQSHGRWMARRGWERAANTLHVERDLLAGKSRAAIQAHLEREMLELPPMEALLRDSIAPVPSGEHSLAVHAAADAGDTIPWETLGLVPPDKDIPDRMYIPPPKPKFEAPSIPGVSDYALDRLYGEGKFDEIVALLRTRLMILRDRGTTSEGVEDYLRHARSQQLHRELEKYRREYDQQTLQPTAHDLPPPAPATAPAPPHGAAPDS